MILIIRTCVRKIFRIIRRNNDKEGMISLNGEYDTIYSSKEAYEKRNYNLNYDSCILDFSLPRFLSFPEINAANVAEYLHSMAKKKKNVEKSHNFSRERGTICTQTVILSVVSL